MRKTYSGKLTSLPSNGIFQYGDNPQHRHGKGAALAAVQYFGAKNGVGGLCGQSYGIVTKDLTKSVHPSVSRQSIIADISIMYAWAISNPEKDVYVAYSTGPNLCGYTPLQLAEMYNQTYIPPNIVFEKGFWELIQSLDQ